MIIPGRSPAQRVKHLAHLLPECGLAVGILSHDECSHHQILCGGNPSLQGSGGAAPSVGERKERMRPAQSPDVPAPRSPRIDPEPTSQRVR